MPFVNSLFDPSEHLILRRHPVSLLVPLVWAILMLLPLLLIMLSLNLTGLIESPDIRSGAWLFGGLYAAFVLSYFMTQWIFWYLDAWHLTPETLTDIELTGIFHRSVAQTNLDQVQDVRVSIQGYLANIFNFGNITVQTAGKQSFFELRAISHPHSVAQKIANYSEAARQRSENSHTHSGNAAPPPNTEDELGIQ